MNYMMHTGPSNLLAMVISSTEVRLSWDHPATCAGVSHSDIELSPGVCGLRQQLKANILSISSDSTSLKISNLEESAKYQFELTAHSPGHSWTLPRVLAITDSAGEWFEHVE